MKKASSGRHLDATLEVLSLIYSFKLYNMPRSKDSSGVYRPKKKKNALLACLAQRLSAFTSRCRTDAAGRGALEPSPEDGARTKRFDGEFQFRESHTERPRRKKTPDRIPPKKNDHIYIYNFCNIYISNYLNTFFQS